MCLKFNCYDLRMYCRAGEKGQARNRGVILNGLIAGAQFMPVLRIHDILRWIRIWIRIRILDPDPAIFVIDLQDASKKLLIF